jgi:hypothetical protein
MLEIHDNGSAGCEGFRKHTNYCVALRLGVPGVKFI